MHDEGESADELIARKKGEAPDWELVEQAMSPAPSEVFTLHRVEIGSNGERTLKPAGTFRMRLLTLDEQIAATRDAQEFARKAKEDQREFGQIYEMAQGLAVIAKALCSPDLYERKSDGTSFYPPIFTEIRHMLKRFTEADIAHCLNVYTFVRERYNPLISFSPGEVDRTIARLAHPVVGGHFLGLLDSSQLRVCLLSVAARAFELSPTHFQDLDQSLTFSESELGSSDPGTTSFSGLLNSHAMGGLVPTSSHDAAATLEDGTEIPDDIEAIRDLAVTLKKD